MTMCHKTSFKTGYTLFACVFAIAGTRLVFIFYIRHDSYVTSAVINYKQYHAYISHVSRYSLDQKKVSSRSRLGHSRVSSRSRLGQFGKRLGLVSVSGAQVSVLVSVSTQKVLGPSLSCSVQFSSFMWPNDGLVFIVPSNKDIYPCAS